MPTRSDEERTVKIVGVDEVDLAKGHVSWISPIAKALLRAEEGDMVKLRTPAGVEETRDREGRLRLIGRLRSPLRDFPQFPLTVLPGAACEISRVKPARRRSAEPGRP